jgi:membrane protein DedA with SNARE-associated domain
MMADITHWIMASMQANGPSTVFIGVIIESIIVPIPSPLIIMGAGAILIEPGLSIVSSLMPIFLKIVLPGAVASTLGAYFSFFITYFGGKPAIDRFSWLLGFNWENLMKMERHIAGRVPLMIFLLRAAPIVPLSLVSSVAGVVRIPIAQFTLWTFLGSIPRCLLLGVLGYLMRDSYEGLAGQLNHIEALASVTIVLGTFAIILWLRAKMKKKM